MKSKSLRRCTDHLSGALLQVSLAFSFSLVPYGQESTDPDMKGSAQAVLQSRPFDDAEATLVPEASGHRRSARTRSVGSPASDARPIATPLGVPIRRALDMTLECGPQR
jgi:hypothetical protein